MLSDTGWELVLDGSRSQQSASTPAGRRPAEGAAASSPHEPPSGHPGSEPMEWLMAMLQQAMQELMAAEIPPLQRANAIARLGSLFLRAQRAAELQRANRALKAQVKELENRLAVLEAMERTATVGAARPPAAGRTDRTGLAEAQLATQGSAPPSVPPEPPAPAQPTATDPPTVMTNGARAPGAATVCPAGAPAVTVVGARGSP